MKIWILQTGEPLHIDSGGLRPMRAMNLSNALIEKGHEVVLWSSDFDHFTKKHRTGKSSTFEISKNLKIKLIHSRGYSRHIGFARLFDHAQLAFNLARQIRRQSLPDIAFIGYPPIEPAWVLTKYLHTKKIPILVDVKDAWPDIFVEPLNKKYQKFALSLLWPYVAMMKSVLKKSSGINSVTEDFLAWSTSKINRQVKSTDHVTFLTAPDNEIEEKVKVQATTWWNTYGLKDSDTPIFSFVGTINNVYDFSQILYAAKNSKFKFVIAGDGPNRELILKESVNLPNLILPGWINEAQSTVLAEYSAAVIIPTRNREDFGMNITNKFFDAMKFGLPIITSAPGIAEKLLNENRIGMTFKIEDESSLLKTILKIIETPNLISEFSENSENLYAKKFSHKKNYDNLVEHLEYLYENF